MKKGNKELSARSLQRSRAQSERRLNEKKAKEAEIRRQVEEYLNGRGIGGRETGAAKGGSVSSVSVVQNETDAASEIMMVGTSDSDCNIEFNLNSSSNYNVDDHHNELLGDDYYRGNQQDDNIDDEEADKMMFETVVNKSSSSNSHNKDIRSFFIPLAANDREQAATAVQLFAKNYRNSSLTGSLAELKTQVSNQCLKDSLVQKMKKKRVSNNEDDDDDDDSNEEGNDEAASERLLNYEDTLFTVNFDDEDDQSDEDYVPENYDALIENHDYEMDEEERASEMDEDGNSVDDGTAVQMQENFMECEIDPYEGFKIGVLSQDITDRILLQSLPRDDGSDLVVMEDSKSTSTKGEFCRDINSFLVVHNIGASKEAKDGLIKMLYKHIPELNLPIFLNRKKNQCQNLDSYVETDLRNLSFDCCKAGCTVFVGTAFSKLESCEHCQSSRYLPCTREPCKTHPNRICKHQKKNRVPVQKLYYRPIIPLIAMLLKTEGFLIALQYKYVQYSGQQFGDLSDGSSIKNHLKQMKDVFDNFFDDNPLYMKQDYVFVPLLFGKNYDGVQVYSSKHSNFHPLFLTILNLPPSYRNKAGVNYFVVGRLVSYVYDTPALEDALKCQGTASGAGCSLCFSVDNQTVELDSGIGKKYTFGHSALLPWKHPIRFHGISGKCCPRRYFHEPISKTVPRNEPRSADPKRFNRFNVTYLGSVCNTDMTEEERNFLCNVNQPGNDRSFETISEVEWEPEVLRWLQKWYCDYRPVRSYKKKDRNFYFANANRAPFALKQVSEGVKGLQYEAYLPYYEPLTDICYDLAHCISNIMKNIFCVWIGERGGKGAVALCKTQNIFPIVWAAKEEEEAAAQSKGKKKTSSRSSTRSVIEDPKWKLDLDCQRRIDAFVNSIRIPYGVGSDFDVENIFARTGHIRSIGHQQVLSVLMELILFICFPQMPYGYIYYYRILSQAVTRLLQPCFQDTEEIDHIYNLIVEAISYHEYLFPPNESLMAYHQLVDIIKYIPVMGQVRGFWTYGGERGNAFVKKFLHRGGSNYEKSTIERYAVVESYKIKEAYDFNILNIQDFGRLKSNPRKLQTQKSLNGQLNIKICGNGELLYDDQRNFLYPLDPMEGDYGLRLNDFEVETLVNCCMRFLTLKQKTEIDCVDKDEDGYYLQLSSLQRIGYSFDHYDSKYPQNDGLMWFCRALIYIHHRLNYPEFILSPVQRLNISSLIKEHAAGPISLETKQDILDNGTVLAMDINTICVELVYGYRINLNDIALDAVIKGCKFRARGLIFRENLSSRDTVTATNPLNDLQEYWDSSKLYSSWCKLKSDHPRDHYANINFFWTLRLKSDSYLDGNVLLASTVARKPAEITGKRFQYVNFVETGNNNMDSFYNFVSFSEIYSTRILTIPCVDIDKDKPLTYRRKKGSQNSSEKIDWESRVMFADKEERPPTHIMMIELEPHRLHL